MSCGLEGINEARGGVCSFCGKRRNEVAQLIAGPTVFICDECVELSNDILIEEQGLLSWLLRTTLRSWNLTIWATWRGVVTLVRGSALRAEAERGAEWLRSEYVRLANEIDGPHSKACEVEVRGDSWYEVLYSAADEKRSFSFQRDHIARCGRGDETAQAGATEVLQSVIMRDAR